MKKLLRLGVLFGLMVVVSSSAMAQQRTITGKITAKEDNSALPGVNVVIKGTTIGTITDFDGNYSINIPPPLDQTILVISYIGYSSQEITVGTRSVINVELAEDAKALEEVVINGFQTIDRKLFTGSAAKLDMDDVKLEGVSDISRSLQGQVAGVEIENVSGTFGTAPVVRVRGNASINGANKPLWVIDGVVLEDAVELTNEDITSGNLSTVLSSSTVGINPEDIESFQILKDASATALYGAKAMNGVIVVTTKRGEVGTPVVNFTSNVTVKSKPTYAQFNILNSGDEMAVYQELYEKGWIDLGNSNSAQNHGAMGKMFRKIAQGELSWGPNGGPNYNYLQRYADANTDWFDLLFKNSLSVQNSISVTSGSENARYRVSIGYFNDIGQTIADNVKNYTAALSANFNVSEKVDIGFQITGNVRDQKIAASEKRRFNTISGKYERNFDINPFNYALYTSRSITPFKEDGTREFFRRNYAPFNIFHEIEHNSVQLDLTDMKFQVDLGYKITDRINFRTSLQGRWFKSKAITSIHENSNKAQAYRNDDPVIAERNRVLFDDPTKPQAPPYSVLPQGGFKNTTENLLTSYFMRNTLDYSPEINDFHEVNVMIGQEVRYNDRSKDYVERWGYVFDKAGLLLTDPNYLRFLNNAGLKPTEETFSRNRSWGTFVNLAYAYQGKYVFNGTIRVDGDNRTGKSAQARYLPTWNVSGAWNIHKENWMDNIDIIDMLKLKTTYGLSGDNPVNASAALRIEGQEPLRPHIRDREATLKILDLENNDLTFEKLYEWNLGLEVGILNSRIFAEIEYYNRKSKDLLGYIETNGVGGKRLKYGNVGEMEINGVEVTLRTRNLNINGFKWTTQFNFNANSNEIVKWTNRNTIGDAVGRNGANLKGFPRGALFSIQFHKLDENGVPTFLDKNNKEKKLTQLIDFQKRDSVQNILKYEGSTTPTSFGGITNNFIYKNFTLSIGITYRYGNKIRMDDFFRAEDDGTFSDFNSMPGNLINRWSFPGDEDRTRIPAIIDKNVFNKLEQAGLNPYDIYNKSDDRVADGHFIRVKNIRLGYNIPNSFLDKFKIKDASVSLSGFNLWLLYSDDKLNGIDPEFFQSGGIALPLTRSYTFTLNVKF